MSVAGVSRSAASMCLSVCLSVCRSVCLSVHTIKPQYYYQTCQRDSLSITSPRHQLILSQKVKGQGHGITKCKNTLKAIEWPA